MMPLKENKSNTDSDKKNTAGTGALKTEEILSLLSKTNEGFKKESEITDKISSSFKKQNIYEFAKKDEISDTQILQNKIDEDSNFDQVVDKDDQKNLEADVSPEVKTYTEEEVKKIANEVANKNYYKGVDEGTKKIKLELEKGDKALAIALKNLTDNLFEISPSFSQKINKSINGLIINLAKEIIGYEIDTKTNLFFKKINDSVLSIENNLKSVRVFLNKDDHNSIKKYVENNKIQLSINISIDESLSRGDIKIKCGAIELEKKVEKNIKFSENDNFDEIQKKNENSLTK